MPYDAVPAWATPVITATTPPEEVAPRLADALRPVLTARFPGGAMAVRAGGNSVVVRWSGGPSPQEVVDAIDLGYVYEDRGAWIATIDYADHGLWPADAVVSIVLRPDQPA